MKPREQLETPDGHVESPSPGAPSGVNASPAKHPRKLILVVAIAGLAAAIGALFIPFVQTLDIVVVEMNLAYYSSSSPLSLSIVSSIGACLCYLAIAMHPLCRGRQPSWLLLAVAGGVLILFFPFAIAYPHIVKSGNLRFWWVGIAVIALAGAMLVVEAVLVRRVAADYRRQAAGSSAACSAKFPRATIAVLLTVACLSAATLVLIGVFASDMPVLKEAETYLSKGRTATVAHLETRPKLLGLIQLWAVLLAALLLAAWAYRAWAQRRRAQDPTFRVPRRAYAICLGIAALAIAAVIVPALRLHSGHLRARTVGNMTQVLGHYNDFMAKHPGQPPRSLEELQQKTKMAPALTVDPYSGRSFEFFAPADSAAFVRSWADRAVLASAAHADGYRAVVYADGRFAFVAEADFQRDIKGQR